MGEMEWIVVKLASHKAVQGRNLVPFRWGRSLGSRAQAEWAAPKSSSVLVGEEKANCQLSFPRQLYVDKVSERWLPL